MVGQYLCDPGGAIFIFGPAIAFVAVNDRGLVGNCPGNVFPDIGHLPGHAILSYFFGENSQIAVIRNQMAMSGIN